MRLVRKSQKSVVKEAFQITRNQQNFATDFNVIVFL